MQINNVKDMIKYRNYFLNKLAEDSFELDELNKNVFSDRQRKKELKERIDKWNYGLNKIENIMIEGACFETKDFAPFLTNFLTLTEKDFRLTTIKIQKIKNGIKGRWCYFVSNDKIHDFLVENVFDESDYSYFIDNVLDNDTYIFDEEYTYPFNSDFTLKENYSKYPRLKTAIYELIELKLKNKDLTDEERLQIVLENTIKRNIEHGYQKKKINN